MAGEWCDCPERLCEAAGPRGASDPATFAFLCHLLEAPEAGGPGPRQGEFCHLPFPFLPQVQVITQQFVLNTPASKVLWEVLVVCGCGGGTLPLTVTGQQKWGTCV